MAIVIGLIIGVSLTILFFVMGAFLLGAIFLILTFESFRSFKYYRMMTEKDRDDNTQSLLKSAEAELAEGNVERALEKFEEVRKKTKKGVLYTIATQEMARVYKHIGNYEEGYELLYPIRKSLSDEMLSVFHELAFKTKHYKEAIEIGDQSFQSKPTAQTALINAYSFAGLKKAEPAIGWLECAIREGAPKDVISNKELNPIKDDPKFHEFVKNKGDL